MVLLFEKIFQYPRFHNMQKLPTEKARIHKRRVQAIGGNFKTQNGNVKDA